MTGESGPEEKKDLRGGDFRRRERHHAGRSITANMGDEERNGKKNGTY